MTYFRSWDAFDFRKLDLNAIYEAATNLGFDNDSNTEFRGETYQDLLYNYWTDDTEATSFELMGRGITISNGAISGGRIEAIANWFYVPEDDAWFYNLAITGFDVAATKVNAAQLTPGTGDDRALLAEILSGNDQITLSGQADAMNGFGGHDRMKGAAGNDSLWGGAGNDRIQGDGGDDRILGDAGRDRIWGGAGDDTLTGGKGGDVFLFNKASGSDRITDYRHGIDRIEIAGLAERPAGLEIRAAGDDTVIEWRQMELRLVDVDAALISWEDLI